MGECHSVGQSFDSLDQENQALSAEILLLFKGLMTSLLLNDAAPAILKLVNMRNVMKEHYARLQQHRRELAAREQYLSAEQHEKVEGYVQAENKQLLQARDTLAKLFKKQSKTFRYSSTAVAAYREKRLSNERALAEHKHIKWVITKTLRKGHSLATLAQQPDNFNTLARYQPVLLKIAKKTTHYVSGWQPSPVVSQISLPPPTKKKERTRPPVRRSRTMKTNYSRDLREVSEEPPQRISVV